MRKQILYPTYMGLFRSIQGVSFYSLLILEKKHKNNLYLCKVFRLFCSTTNSITLNVHTQIGQNPYTHNFYRNVTKVVLIA